MATDKIEQAGGHMGTGQASYRWIRVTGAAPLAARDGAGALSFKGKMWILGGGTYDTPEAPQRKFFNDVWSTEDGLHWKCHTAAAPWHPRQYHEVAVFDGRLWVMEGWNRGNRNDVWHSADGERWEELPRTPWNPRHAASVFVHDDALWMVAGNNMEPDVWKLFRTRRRSA